MSDIVDELKRVSRCVFKDGWESSDLHARAGIEIVRLRARVTELRALSATQEQVPVEVSEPEGWELVPKSAIMWLIGAGPDANGDWFEKPDGAPSFWWRTHFNKLRGDAVASRSALASTPPSPVSSERPPYPEGTVVGPCVCGSWPGGPCLKCEWIEAEAPVSSETVEVRDHIALVLHDKMCEQDVNGYLDAKINAAELADAVLAALQKNKEGNYADKK